MWKPTLVLFMLFCAGLMPAHAQTDDDACGLPYADRLDAMLESCPQVAPDTACLSDGVTFRQRAASDGFALDALDSVATGELTEVYTSPYGFAVLRPRAGFVEDAVTIVAYGDAQVDNLSAWPVDLRRVELTVGTEGALVRERPAGDVIEAYFFGDTAPVFARTADGAWLATAFTEDFPGWISSATVDIDDETLDTLWVLPPSAPLEPPFFAPFQSIALATAEGLLNCRRDGESGVLLQAPADQTAVMQVNGAILRFDGTLRLENTDVLTLDVLEGTLTLGDLTYAETERTVITFQDDGDVLRIRQTPLDYVWYLANAAPLDLLPRPVELAFNTEGLLTAFEPGTGFLTSMLVTDPCVVAWTASVNLRGGPGMDYPIRGAVLENFAASASARSADAEGVIWWRITEGAWISSENTIFGGDCDALPVVEPPEREP